MPYKALSERVKRQNQSRAKAATMRNAVNAYHREQAQPEGQCTTLRAENVHVEDLPPKPKCPLKPRPALGGDGEADKSSDSSDGDDES
jgi:hypothetical protein